MTKRAVLAAIGLLWLVAGCGFGIPLERPTRVTDQERRSVALQAGVSSREDVRAALGEPWLESAFWRFEVYRAVAEEKELGFVVLFTPPIPIGLTRAEVGGFVLVAYDDAGRVTALRAGQARRGSGLYDSLMLRAGDLYLGIEPQYRRGPQVFADDTRLEGYLDRRRRASTCTLLLACQQASVTEKWPDEGCPDRITIDGSIVADPSPYVGACTAGTSCPAAAVHEGPYARVPVLMPVMLRPGEHRVVIGSSVFKGTGETSFACAAGEVRYGILRGAVTWHWWGPRRSTLAATMTLSDRAPRDPRSFALVVHRGDGPVAEP
jgi:hypothetical protein